MGVPVIGSMAPGIVETFGRNGERGLLFSDTGTVLDFKNKINFCLEESDARSKMIKEARNYVEEQYKNSININQIVELKD